MARAEGHGLSMGVPFKRLVVIAAAVIGLLAVVSVVGLVRRGADPAAGDGEGAFAVSVEVAPVELGSIRHTVQYVGSVHAYESVTILPKVTGILTSFPIQIGDEVTQGQPIAVIDDAEFKQRLDQAQANLQLAQAQLQRAKINLDLAERELGRVQTMASQGLTSDQLLDQATSKRDGAKADVQLAEADVTRASAAYDEAQINYENTKITARLTGSVDDRRVDAGALVSPATPLCTIVRTDPAKVILNIPEAEIETLHVGSDALVTAAAGTVEVHGRVERVSPTVDPATRTMTAEVVVPNSNGALRPGMYAEVEILLENKAGVVLAPEQAIVRREGRTEVFTVTDGVAHNVQVTVGVTADGKAEVVDGLAAGDTVVVRGQYLLNEGDPVRVQTPA